MGQLRNKCVLEWPGVESGVRNWTEWVLDANHWIITSKGPLLCGNVSGARYVLALLKYGYFCNSCIITEPAPLAIYACLM